MPRGSYEVPTRGPGLVDLTHLVSVSSTKQQINPDAALENPASETVFCMSNLVLCDLGGITAIEGSKASQRGMQHDPEFKLIGKSLLPLQTVARAG